MRYTMMVALLGSWLLMSYGFGVVLGWGGRGAWIALRPWSNFENLF